MGLYVDEFGAQAVPTAPTIVWLHGGGIGGWMWEPQLRAFTDYHCLVPDLPGNGHSVNEPLTSISDCAAQVAELIRSRAHGGKAHVVGLSFGAQTTVGLLALAPELVDHAMASGALLRPMAGSWMLRPGLLRFLFQTTVSPLKKIDGWARLNMKYASGIPDQYFPQFRDEFRATTADSFTQVMVANQAFRLPAGLDRVSAPVLVLMGQKEKQDIRQSARDLVAALPNGRAYVVSQPSRFSLAQSHNWSLNMPDLFNRTVRAWITDMALPDALQPLG